MARKVPQPLRDKHEGKVARPFRVSARPSRKPKRKTQARRPAPRRRTRTRGARKAA